MIFAGIHTVVPADIDCYAGINLEIGKYTSIASGLKIYSGNHPTVEHPQAVANYPFYEHGNLNYYQSSFNGKVTIGNDVWIAKDVRILEGVSVGDGAIIGAGSLVTKDVPAYSFVAGVPAKIKRNRFTEDQITNLLKISWWDWEESLIQEAVSDMKDVNSFIEKYL